MPFLLLLLQISMPISFLYFKSASYLMYDIHTNTAPTKIVNLFQPTSSIHAYNTRSSSKNNMHTKKFTLRASALRKLKNSYCLVALK